MTDIISPGGISSTFNNRLNG